MKSSFVRKTAVVFIACMLVFMVFSAALAEEYSAQTMRLTHYEGNVEILDAGGNPRFVMENIRFASGEAMRTDVDSYASVSLDATKIVTMDQQSLVEFQKKGNQIALKLKNGSMLLDVQKKLNQNESLDIETSTMVVGIRGTVVALSDFPVAQESESIHVPTIDVLDNNSNPSKPAASGSTDVNEQASAEPSLEEGKQSEAPKANDKQTDSTAVSTDGLEKILDTDVIGSVHGRVSVLCVLEGVATVTYRDMDGVLHTVDVKAGEKAILTDRLGNGQVEESAETERLYKEDLENFVINQVESDPTLKSRVENASDVLTNSNPIYNNPIVFTAGSAEKSFDGLDFEGENLEVSAAGLPEDYVFSAVSVGNQINAGSSENAVARYAIYDNHGLDVTERFNNIRTEEGTLTVTWDNPVTLVAQSASKMYNSEPLRRTTDVLVYGLPTDNRIRVFANGSQTDAGTSPNSVGSYTIYNSQGEDVTGYFTNVQKVSGQLVVDPAPLTVWTGSAEKTYDGKPLTNSDALVTSVPGYERGMVPWRNLSYVTTETEIHTEFGVDCQALYGICGIVLVHGTNPLTGETREIELHAGQKLLVYLHDEANVQSIEFKLEDVSETDLPEKILRLFASNPDLMKRSCADAAWDADVLAELIAALPELTEEENMVEQAGLQVVESEAEHLMTDFTNVRITIDTEITDYTDRALGHEEAHYTPVYIDETIKVKATGSQTEVGESKNTYDINWGSANPRNYTLTEDLGTLKVLANTDYDAEVILYTNFIMDNYTGQPLKDDTVEVEGLPEGYTLVATVTGSQTDAGSSNNTVKSYKIFDESGTDVTSHFTNVTIEEGTLMVFPANATITTGSANKVYDGTPLTSTEATIEGLVNGETATVAATGTITEPGKTNNTYKIDWGNTKSSNYDIEESLGTLTVDKLELAIDLGNVTTDYSGSPAIPNPTLTYVNGAHAGETVTGSRLRSMSVVFRFHLFTGDTVDLSITGMEAAAGTYTLETEVTFPEEAKDRYTVTSTTGTTMTVNPAQLTIIIGSASKAYDGEALTCTDVTVEGLADGDEITITPAGTITDVGEAQNTYTIDWGEVNKDNYTITEELGTLEITKNDTEITITAASASKTYDGKELTANTVEVSGLPGALTCEAVVSGTQTDAGNSENTVTSYKILDKDGKDVTVNFTRITTKAGTLTVDPAPLTVTTGSDSKKYDGAPLTKDEAAITGLMNGETATVTATGTITDIGTATNTHNDIFWGTAKEANYTITEELGTLEITVNDTEITFTAASASKTYDGTVLTNSSVTVENLPDALTYEATAGGEQTDANKSDNKVISYKILDKDNNEVTANFTNITTVDGTLEVMPLPITFDVFGEEEYHFVYNGVYVGPAFGDTFDEDTEVFPIVKGTYENGDPVEFTNSLFGIDTPAPCLTGYFNLTGGAKVNLTFDWYADADTYTMEPRVGFTEGKDTNYKFSYINNTLVIDPLEISINLDKCQEFANNQREEYGVVYYGYPYCFWFDRNEGAYAVYTNGPETGTILNPSDLENFPTGYEAIESTTATYALPGDGEVEVKLIGYIDAGTHPVIPEITITKGKDANYDISYTNCTLVIDPLEVFIDLDSGYSATFTNLMHLPRNIYAYWVEYEEERNLEATENKRVYNSNYTKLLYYMAKYDLIGEDKVEFHITGPRTVDDEQRFISEVAGFTGRKQDNYKFTFINDEITITPLDVNLYLVPEAVFEEGIDYDGQYHSADPYVGGYSWLTPKQVDENTWDFYGSIKNTVFFRLKVTGGGKDVQTLTYGGEVPEIELAPYVLEYEITYPTVSKDNFGEDGVHVYNDYFYIMPARLSITTGSASKVYDGTPLTAEATVEGLVEGDTITVTTTSITNAEEVDNEFIIDWGTTNKDNYAFTHDDFELGELVIMPRDVEFDLGGTTVAYEEGKFHGGELFVYCDGLDTTVAKISENPDPANPYTKWRVTFSSGDVAEVTITGGGIDEDVYTLDYTCEFKTGSVDNFNITKKYDELIVSKEPIPSPGPLSIITGSASKLYDGTPLTNPEATIEGLRHKDEDSVKITATGSQTEVGTSDNTYEIEWIDPTISDCYYIDEEHLGELKVMSVDDPITIIAGSASKVFDGTALTCEELKAEGLPDGYTCTGTAVGSQTKFGESENAVGDYTITDTEGNEVTGVFTNITEVPGKLTVTQNDTKITITAGSFDRKYSPLYDGTIWLNGKLLDATCKTYSFEGLPEGFTGEATTEGYQYVAGTSDNVIASYTIKDGNGEDVTDCFSNVVLVKGTLNVTKAKIHVWSHGGTYDEPSYYEGTYRGSAYAWGITWSGVMGGDNPTVWDLSFTDAYNNYWTGTDAGAYTLTYTATIDRENLKDKYEIGQVDYSTFTINPAPLTVTTGSATKVYDGTPLMGEANIEGLVASETAPITGTSITDAGSVRNDYTIDWDSGTAKESNYTIESEDIGTLTIEPATLTVITDSNTKPYDGTELTAGARLVGLVPGEDVTVTATGTITDAGQTTNTYKINWGTINPNNYIIVEQLGMLSITEAGEPAPLTVITESAEKTYDGTELTAGARLVGLSKTADATVKSTGTITHAGSVTNTYEIDWGTTNQEDYTITEDLGTLTVTKADLTVITESAEKTYDGKPLTAGASLEGLMPSDNATVTSTTSITDAGYLDNRYEFVWGTTNPDDYNLIEDIGELHVNKAPLTVTTGSDSKRYDGKPLTCDEASIEGLQNDETATIEATGTITELGSTENTYKITWGTADKNNYYIEEEYLGWLYVYGGSGGEILLDKSVRSIQVIPSDNNEPMTSDEPGNDTVSDSENEIKDDVAEEFEIATEAEFEVEPEAKSAFNFAPISEPADNEVVPETAKDNTAPEIDTEPEKPVAEDLNTEESGIKTEEPITEAEPTTESNATEAEASTEVPVADETKSSEPESAVEEPAAEPDEEPAAEENNPEVGTVNAEAEIQPDSEELIVKEPVSDEEPEEVAADEESGIIEEPVAEGITAVAEEPAEEEVNPESADSEQSETSTEPQLEFFTGSVTVELQSKGDVFEGDTVVFKAIVKGDKSLVTIHWQKLVKNDQTNEKEWKNIATGEKLSLEANEANAGEKYRVVLLDADRNVCSEAPVSFPAIQQKVTETAEQMRESTSEHETEDKSEPEVESASDPEAEPAAEPEVTPETKLIVEVQNEPAPEPVANQQVESETPAKEEPLQISEPEVVPEVQPESEPKAEVSAEPEAPAKEEPVQTSEPTNESSGETATESVTIQQPETVTEQQAAPETPAKEEPAPAPETNDEPKSEPVSTSEPETPVAEEVPQTSESAENTNQD